MTPRGLSAVIGFLARVAITAALILAGWLLGGLPLTIIATLIAVPLFVRTQDGRIWWSAILSRLRFRLASARGLTHFADSDRLPGTLGTTTLVQTQPYAILGGRDRYSVVVRFDAEHSDWLDGIDSEPGLVAVSITTQTGAAVRSGFAIAPSAGALTRSVLHEALPITAGIPTAWACLTWRGDAPPTEAIEAFLQRAGLQPLDGPAVAAVVSTAFVPDREPITSWEHTGPGSAHEFKNRYEHAGFTSVVWHVASGAGRVAELLGDESRTGLGRVTAVYTPQPGIGGLRQSVLVTLTCPDEHSLAREASALRVRATGAAVTLAPCATTMASSFAVGLGVGVAGVGR